MKISVITINRNDREGLWRTILSVAGQTIRPHEFIVIDGASTDGSADLLDEFSGDITYGVSEPDKGIYNAMNKGIAAATGDYCIFMNAGDTFCGQSVIWMSAAAEPWPTSSAATRSFSKSRSAEKHPPAEISLRFMYGTALCHQAVFIKTDLLRKHPYDETLKIVSDRKFFFQSLIFDNCSYQAVDIDICNYDVSGYSAKNRFASEQEWRGVLESLLPERILRDYGREAEGALFGTSAYERLFLEIGRRRWREPVYKLVKGLLSLLSFFAPSARFVRFFPRQL